MSAVDNVAIKALNGTTEVFIDVSPDDMKARDINATKIDFSVYEGSAKLSEIEDIILERNNHYSIFFNGHNAHFVQAEISKQN